MERLGKIGVKRGHRFVTLCIFDGACRELFQTSLQIHRSKMETAEPTNPGWFRVRVIMKEQTLPVWDEVKREFWVNVLRGWAGN